MNPEHIKCPICQEIFDGNVYVLKCGHNLCSYCISKVYLDNDGSYSDSEDDDNDFTGFVKCPVCTAITYCNKKSNGTITGITRNITIESITQDYRETNGLLTSLDKERKENLFKKGQKMQDELEEKLKFLEIARKLLSNKDEIVNVKNSISAMLNDFQSSWENNSVKKLRWTFSVKDLIWVFNDLRWALIPIIDWSLWMTHSLLPISYWPSNYTLVPFTNISRKQMDDLDKALSRKMENEIFNLSFGEPSTDSIPIESTPERKFATWKDAVNYHQMITKDGEQFEQVIKHVGPIWGQYEAGNKVRRFMRNEGMQNWEWTGHWNSEGGTSYAQFHRKINQ